MYIRKHSKTQKNGDSCIPCSDCNPSVEARNRKNAFSMIIIAWFQRKNRGRISSAQASSCHGDRKYSQSARAAIIEGGKGWCWLIRIIGSCTVVMHHAHGRNILQWKELTWSLLFNHAQSAGINSCMCSAGWVMVGLAIKGPSILPLHHWLRSFCL